MDRCDNYTPEQLRMVTFKLALENAAMLRMMLANQVLIMEKMGIKFTIDENVFNDLLPNPEVIISDVTKVMSAIDPLSKIIQKRAWEWVNMNDAEVAASQK